MGLELKWSAENGEDTAWTLRGSLGTSLHAQLSEGDEQDGCQLLGRVTEYVGDGIKEEGSMSARRDNVGVKREWVWVYLIWHAYGIQEVQQEAEFIGLKQKGKVPVLSRSQYSSTHCLTPEGRHRPGSPPHHLHTVTAIPLSHHITFCKTPQWWQELSYQQMPWSLHLQASVFLYSTSKIIFLICCFVNLSPCLVYKSAPAGAGVWQQKRYLGKKILANSFHHNF